MIRKLVPLFAFASTVYVAKAEPDEMQISRDAANFHSFRLTVLTKAAQLNLLHAGGNAAARFIGNECSKLAHRTTPNYLFGVVTDLIHDDSHTEEPYFIAI
jgi:hypothetical protein